MTDGPTPYPPADQPPSWPSPQPASPGTGWNQPPSSPTSPGTAWNPQPANPQPANPQPANPGWQPQPGQPPVQPGWQPQPGWQGVPGQPGAMPPGSFVPGDQGPKKRRKWPWILLAIFLLMVLGIGACTFFVVRAISGPTDYANTFADQLYSNPSGAASELCPGSTIDAAGLQKAQSDLIANGWTGSKALYGAQVNSTNGQSTAAIAGTLGSTAVTIELEKRTDEWCVMNFIDTSTVSQLPDISIPDISIPDISIPDFTIPDLTIPDITIPDLSIPDISVPELEITPVN